MFFRKQLFCLTAIVALLVAPLAFTYADSLADQENALRAQLAQEQALLKQLESKRDEIVKTGNTITSDIKQLDSQIAATKKQIDTKNKLIANLSSQIQVKVQAINELDTKRAREEQSLAHMIRAKAQAEQETLPSILASGEGLSEFFISLDTFDSINRSLQESFGRIKNIRQQTATQKAELEKKKESEADIKYSLESDKKKAEIQQKQKQVLLADNKSQQKGVELSIKEKQSRIAEINSRLFELRGLSSGKKGIDFGTAYALAKNAGNLTGVRPAFILAILTQESSLGKNVGTCNRPGDTKTWKDIMPGPNSSSSRDDQSAYLRIVNALGIPPEGQPLSCPLPSGGWGGAMGPSQFIPTTWERFAPRIQSKLGVSVADPWEPSHAILATALYVADLGASAQTYTTERNAACKYYSGRTCDAPNVKNAFYGNSVMKYATQIQTQIDELEQLKR
jgi:membrane-bound lytic murein transglycosylase B